MRRSLIGLAFSVAGLGLACGGAPEGDDVAGSAQDAIGTRNSTGASLGIADHELMLTLDDGPGERTVELAEWLAKEHIPATFFMVGKNAKARPRDVARVVELSNLNNGLFIVANHSMNHQAKPLPTLGTNTTIDEIMGADAVLAESIVASQRVGHPNAVSFFRPPYGDFVRLGPANIARINAAGGEKYSGPVFWDIGGELKGGHAADWACWGKVDVATCTKGYVTEANFRKKGVVLAHDVHSRTVDMLTGSGLANGKSLIKELEAQGFKWVSLRKDAKAVDGFTREQTELSSNAEITIGGGVSFAKGKVHIDVTATGASRISIAVDAEDEKITSGAAVVLDRDLGPGQHVVTVTALDANGAAKKQQRFPVIVPADIKSDGLEDKNEQNAACIKFSILKDGSKFNVFHGKLACTDARAIKSPVDDECYRFKATLTSSRDPKLVGAGDWSAEFKMTYDVDRLDKSAVEFVIDATTGEIEAGRRFDWKTGAKQTPHAEATFEATSVDCAGGKWRGKIHYDATTSEDFLYVRAQ